MRALLAASVVLLLGLAHAHAEMMVISPALQAIQSLPVASLPVCSAANNGIVYKVTDALLPVLLSVVAGGGAVSVLVQCNGTNFVVG